MSKKRKDVPRASQRLYTLKHTLLALSGGVASSDYKKALLIVNRLLNDADIGRIIFSPKPSFLLLSEKTPKLTGSLDLAGEFRAVHDVIHRGNLIGVIMVEERRLLERVSAYDWERAEDLLYNISFPEERLSEEMVVQALEMIEDLSVLKSQPPNGNYLWYRDFAIRAGQSLNLLEFATAWPQEEEELEQLIDTLEELSEFAENILALWRFIANIRVRVIEAKEYAC